MTVQNHPLDSLKTHILEPSLYAKNLQRWNWQDENTFLLITHEEIVKHPASSLDRLFRFLNVGANDDVRDAFLAEYRKRHRAGVRPRSARHEYLYRQLYSRAVSGPYQRLKQWVGVPTADRWKERLRLRQVAEYLFYKTAERDPASEDDAIPEWAIDLLKEDMAALYGMFPSCKAYWEPA